MTGNLLMNDCDSSNRMIPTIPYYVKAVLKGAKTCKVLIFSYNQALPALHVLTEHHCNILYIK